MADGKLSILQVSSNDLTGGAQRVAWNLFQSYRRRGYDSYLAVGYKQSHDPNVRPMAPLENGGMWSSLWSAVHSRLQPLDGNGRLSRLAHKLAEPGAFLDDYRGIEDFRFPGTWSLLSRAPSPPDIVHCHNLHGGYFDLRVLSRLSHKVPTLMTLHDAWMLSGHCAHSFDCGRWRIGCGQCPDLSIYPSIRKDNTAYNWDRKRQIYSQSRLYVATPSRWLMQKVEESILAVSTLETRVIPNGVNLNVFRPGDRQKVRRDLGLPLDVSLILVMANGIRRNLWKDFATIQSAAERVAERLVGKRLLVIALGEHGKQGRLGRAEIRFVPYQESPEAVSRYYQAADIYIHSARVDTFPNTVLEAMACGTPVVATAVGGIPEQIKGAEDTNGRFRNGDIRGYGPQEATGLLVPPGDAEGMADGIERVLTDEPLRRCLAKNAVIDARSRFSLERQVEAYLEWYDEILKDPTREPRKSSTTPPPLVKGGMSQ